MTNHLPQSSESLREKIYQISLTPIKLINDGVSNPSGSIGLSDDRIDAIMQAVKAELGAAIGEDEPLLANEDDPYIDYGIQQRNQFRAELRNHFGIGEGV